MKNFIWKLYLFRFISSFILIGAIFTLLFQSHGLNTTQIGLLINIWSISTILLEIPTGALADKYSRRNLLIIGHFLRAVGFVFWFVGGFINYAIGFLLWGMQNALSSGTQEAFVYDELKILKQEHQYEKVSGRMRGFTFLGVMLGAVVGGFVSEISFSFAIIASIVGSLIAILLLLTIKSVKAVQSTGETKYFQILKKAIVHIKANHTLLYIILFISITFSVYGAADEFWPLIYKAFGLSLKTIGVLVATGFGIFSLAGYTVHFFDDKRFKNIDKYLIVLSGALFLLAGFTKTVFILIPLVFLAIYLLQIANVKLEAQLQHSINASQRATISSIKSLIFELFYLGFVLGFGLLGNNFSVLAILLVAGGLIFVMGLTYNKLGSSPDKRQMI